MSCQNILPKIKCKGLVESCGKNKVLYTKPIIASQNLSTTYEPETVKMSFVDLAKLTMHRRNELEVRLNVFSEKCDRAINDIKKLKTKAYDFVPELNCEPAELKERFLNCMKKLDEYLYLITDFNLSISQIEETGSSEFTPVHDDSTRAMPAPPIHPFNLMDALTEPTPSTSHACPNQCHPTKPKRTKVPKEDQLLIAFSSGSSSLESVPEKKSEQVKKEVQIKLKEESKITLAVEPRNLPAQPVLEIDHAYSGTIMSIDGAFFWVVTDLDETHRFMIEMMEFYNNNNDTLTLEQVESMIYCAFCDDENECIYRGLYLKVAEEDKNKVEVFAVDTGEIRCVPIECLQPLAEQFCTKPPFARCCHLAGVDLLNYRHNNLMERQEAVMNEYRGKLCKIHVDDNTSESLGVYVILPSKETLNEILVQQGLAVAIDKPKVGENRVEVGPPEPCDSDLDITNGPEYDDPVEAVTGYSNRDEADICKHYKGEPNKTCFKGPRCNKKHILKHPDGWTLDQIEIFTTCKPLPLPEPGTWHKVLVTNVCHFDRVYVQFVREKQKEEVPDFGVILPPNNLERLIQDMNSPAARLAYKPLKLTPAPGELVAALYPIDNCWYRARVMSVSRAEQNVEVMYVDYGTVLWVKEDQVRALEPRLATLPAQAARCALAGVAPRSRCSQQWAAAKRALTDMVQDATLDAHIIARDYDEVTVELYDKDGYSIAEQLAALNMVELKEYAVADEYHVTRKMVIP